MHFLFLKCQKVKHTNFSDVLYYIYFTTVYDKGKHQSLTFEKFQPGNVCHFCFEKNQTFPDYQNSFQLIFCQSTNHCSPRTVFILLQCSFPRSGQTDKYRILTEFRMNAECCCRLTCLLPSLYVLKKAVFIL